MTRETRVLADGIYFGEGPRWRDGRLWFSDMYGDIAQPDVGREYASQLRKGCDDMGVAFVDITPKIAAAIEPTDWIFVDRIHFDDFGYDLVAKLLLDELRA